MMFSNQLHIKRSTILALVLFSMLLIFSSLYLFSTNTFKNRSATIEQLLQVISHQDQMLELLSLFHFQVVTNSDQINHLHKLTNNSLNQLSNQLITDSKLLTELNKLKASIQKQFHQINQYKSVNSVYLNSKNYFPTLVKECQSKLTRTEHKDTLQQVFISSLSDAAQNSVNDVQKLTLSVSRLKSLLGDPHQCAALFKHADILNRYRLKRNVLYQSLLNQNMNNQIMSFYHHYEAESQEKITANQKVSLVLLVLNIFFLGYILSVLNKLARQNKTVVKTHLDLEKQKNIYHALADANQKLFNSHNLKLEDTYQELTDILFHRLQIPCSWFGQEDENQYIQTLAISGLYNDVMQNITISTDPKDPYGQGSICQAYRSQKPVILNDYQNSLYSKPWLKAAQTFNLNAIASFPVVYQNKVQTILTLYSHDKGFFDEQTVDVIKEIVFDLALFIEKTALTKKQQQQESDLAISAIALESNEPILITKSDGSIIKVNRAFTRLTGYAEKDILGLTPRILKSGEQDAEFYQVLWQQAITEGNWQGEMTNRKKDGTIFPLFQTITAVYDESQEITHFISHGVDLTQKKQTEAQIQFLQNHDKLTGLSNQPLLLERIQQQIAQPTKLFSLLFLLNLSRFKVINESLGHAAGDELLKAVSKRLKNLAIPNMIEKTVSRVGSDEFAILLLSPVNTETVLNKISGTILSYIQEAFEREFTVPDNSINIQAAIGVTAFNPSTELAPLEIYQQALTALQRAKLNKISGVQFFETSMQTLALEAFQLEEEIHKAIANKEFVMYYQPQVSANTHAYCGAEALIRWKKPNGEIIPPYKFIPLLESTGLIISVGYWLFETALKETLALPNFRQNKFTLSINLSGVQFKDPYLISTIKKIIADCDFPPARLMLEVTESSLIDDTDLAFKQLNAIQETGIQIAIDDFGTGYSSFAYLKDMPVNELKIDKSFIDDIHTVKGLKITTAVIELAHTLNIEAIAEGVESVEQVQALSAMDCDRIQGYFFSKPLPYEQLLDFLKDDSNQAALEVLNHND